MNKTIIININGTVFHIEEDAYEILKQYMTGVKRHFMHSADSLEITTDIENRIAEMFTDILARDSKQALVEQDVKAVIDQMGSIEDFENAVEEGEATATSTAPGYDNYTSRKLFRDPDDHLLGGVCAGIANYFDFSAAWVRLAFAIAFFCFGTGLALYIILWIVIPKAVTRADRMAMKGEKLNLQGFKRNFEAEMSSVQSNLNDLKHETRPLIYKSRDFVSDFFHYLGVFLKGSGRVLIKLLGIAALLCALGFLIFLVVIVIGALVYGSNEIYDIFPFNIVNYQTSTVYVICGFLLLAIPLAAVILLAASTFIKGQPFNRSTGFTFLAVWIVALCTVIYYTAKVTTDFRAGASFRKSISIAPSSTGTYYLKLNDIKYLSHQDSIRLRVKERFNGMIIIDSDDDDTDLQGPGSSILIEIVKSDVSVPVLIESFSARGPNYEQALEYARNTTYQFMQQDSVLKFSRMLERAADKLWRNQELRLTLKVPLNTKLVIDEELDRYLDGVSIYECKDNNNQPDANAAAFVMTADGLQCKIDNDIITIKPDSVLIEQP